MKQAMAPLLAKDDAALFAKYDALKKDDYPPNFDQAVALLNLHVAEHAALQIMMKLTDDPTDGHRLNNMQWFVREVDGGHDLPVSDKLLQMSYGKDDRPTLIGVLARGTLTRGARDRADEGLRGDVELNAIHGWQ